MSQPRYQIFVSSTFIDLKDERQAVLNAILKLNQFPAGMEIFPAVNDTAWELIEKVIEDSDYYILIIGGKYGSIDEESGISYTEKEYDLAVSRRIPILAFTHSDEESIPYGKVEKNEENRERLKKFKQKVGARHHWNYWKTIDELKANVITSLDFAFKTQPRSGWIKVNGNESEVLTKLEKLQKKCDKLKKINEKLKIQKPQNSHPNLSQGEEIIIFSIKSKLINSDIEISWNQLFIEVAHILFNLPKIPEWELNYELSARLALNYSTNSQSLQDSLGRIEDKLMNLIGNQFIALNLLKIVFDRQACKCWALTEPGRKQYALQIAIKQSDNDNYINENFNCQRSFN